MNMNLNLKNVMKEYIKLLEEKLLNPSAKEMNDRELGKMKDILVRNISDDVKPGKTKISSTLENYARDLVVDFDLD